MKNKVIILILIISLFLVGCKNNNKKNIVENLSNKINQLDAYNIKGSLEIINGEDMYIYDVEVSFQKENKFKVLLKNTNNNHVQILLKNQEGVYVLTPSLNKSFKFQSEWPYNNSQIYLFQTIIKDIENDNNRTVEETNNGYIITSKVNYSNNKDLINQKVYIDKNNNITKVEVINKDGNIEMTFNLTNVDLKPTFDDNYFTLDKNLNVSITEEEIKEVSKIDTIIYPLYLPANTYLIGQNVINKDDKERVILTFDGDNSFMLIQETATVSKEPETIPVYGEPIQISDILGIVSDKAVSWSANGIDYYLTSSDLSEYELVSIANSINVLPVGK